MMSFTFFPFRSLAGTLGAGPSLPIRAVNAGAAQDAGHGSVMGFAAFCTIFALIPQNALKLGISASRIVATPPSLSRESCYSAGQSGRKSAIVTNGGQ
jgi:hypothetical protein